MQTNLTIPGVVAPRATGTVKTGLFYEGLKVFTAIPGQAVPYKPGTFAVEVTPALAQDWLNRYADPKKRVIRPFRVVDYAADMASGRWLWGASLITFVTNGGNAVTLDNGHHRLTAITKVKEPVWMMVQTGAVPAIRSVTDVGLTRSSADNLKMWGNAGYHSEIASGVKMTLIYDQTVGTTTPWRGRSAATFRLPTKREMTEAGLADNQRWLEVAATVKGGIKHIPAGIPPKSLFAATYLMEVKHTGEGIAFYNALVAMANPELMSTLIQAARVRPSGSGTQLEFDRWVIEVMVRAFNAHRAGGRRWTKPQRTGTPFTLSKVK